ncbi:hypothetical protein [Chitinophaga nivalis]|uniref:Outer membrane protein beta-barrel domain-containing protein n=1 Tax=Chitinophaga nivalis TaxID=2991709 RepID=A0ABT3IKI2_9BACT|nr:hypothetical protein [Chitinophaga nivalis]MCW3465871.1 hypothetical protein [Chitinophaga nivalis]MCW3484438.1 hypothetical protein [Chitinophaga nivalis]
MKRLVLILSASLLALQAAAQTSRTTTATDIPHFRLAVTGGYGYRLGKISPQLTGEARDYMKKMKSGFNISADALYYFNETLGTGIKYSRFQSSQSAALLVNTAVGPARQIVKDNIAINFIAATFAARIFNPKKTNSFHLNISLGYLGFRDDGAVSAQKVQLTGGTVGLGWDMGYDIRIARKLSAGAQLSLITGKLNSYTRYDGYSRVKVTLKDDEKENLSHLNLSAGLRLNL